MNNTMKVVGRRGFSTLFGGAVAVATTFTCCGLCAATYVLKLPDGEAGATPETAVNWCDASRWTDADGASVSAFPDAKDADVIWTKRMPGDRYVRADRAISIGQLLATTVGADGKSKNMYSDEFGGQKCFISDYPLTVWGSAAPIIQDARLYADLDLKTASYYDYMEACGDVQASSGMTFNMGMFHRCDLYANAAGGVRTDPGCTATIQNSWGNIGWVAPHGAPESFTMKWKQTAGSKFLVLADAAHAIPAGATVSGSGIPSGTFVKRIFGDSAIELSQAAESTVEESEITFGAMAVRMHQHVRQLKRMAAGDNMWEAVKYAPEDELTVEVNELIYASAYTGWIGMEPRWAGCFPGRFVFHDAFGTANGRFMRLGECDVFFAEPLTAGKPAGFAGAKVLQESATCVSRVGVKEGVEASFGDMTDLKGTFRKYGAGVLSMPLTNNAAANSGTLRVDEGALRIVGEGESRIATLAVSNGATLKLAEGASLAVDVAELQAGARIDGGMLSFSSLEEYRKARASGVELVNGAVLAVAGSPETPVWEPVATNVVGVPAVWFDVSREETLTITSSDGKEVVSAIRDVRGAEYATASVPNGSVVGGPTLVRDANGKPQHYFAKYEADGTKTYDSPLYQHVLVWNRMIGTIRCVFKVMAHVETKGTPQFLGHSTPGDSNCAWLRPSGYHWNDPLFYTATDSQFPAVHLGDFRVNGCKRAPASGFAYPGGANGSSLERLYVPQVAELALGPGPSSDADNNGEYVSGGGIYPRAGGLRLYEIICYTNDLTLAERLQVRGYLMRKWLNAEADWAEANEADVEVREDSLALASGQTNAIGVTAGTLTVGTLSGEGMLVKNGPGEVALEDCSADGVDLKIAAGTLRVRSIGEQSLPEDAYLHVCADDASTYELNDNGEVTKWHDVRGEGYLTATMIGSPAATVLHGPKPLANALNGRTGMDMNRNETRNIGTAESTGGFSFQECADMRTVVSVSISETNSAKFGKSNYHGGVIAGSYNHRQFMDPSTYEMYGLWRYGGGNHSGTILSPSIRSRNSGVLLNFTGSGASRTRLNGEQVNFFDTYRPCDGSGDLMSLVTYQPFETDALAIGWNGDSTPTVYYGGQILCETIMYRTALCASSIARVEAYLNKKWFGRESEGLRPARAAGVEVAESARLSVEGGAGISAASIAGGGVIDGDVTLRPGAVFNVKVRDGVVPCLTVNGAVIGGGAVNVTGDLDSLEPGRYELLQAQSLTGDWTFPVISGRRRGISIFRTADGICMEVCKLGLAVIVR